MSNALSLTRALALNDAGGTQLFTFLLSMNDLEVFFERPTRSSPIYYEGHEWYLTCGGYQSKDGEDVFLGAYLYWDNKAAGEGVSCRADYRLIVRNVAEASESVISEGSQVEFSAPDRLGWGKRELAPLHAVLRPGNGFLVDPGRTVIVELAVRYCRTIYQQLVDFARLPDHMNQPFASYFSPNFSLAGFDFYLSFYPLGDRAEAEQHVSMYLHRFDNPRVPESLCCRIRYRFFLGDRVSPSGDSKTFEFSFKTDRGYGRFKAFEPLARADLFRKGLVPLGVEILSIVPFAFAEVPLATRGYYHTDNFVLDDVLLPDHRLNVWKLSVNNSSQYLSFRLDVEDRAKIAPVAGAHRQAPPRDLRCTKYLQWKAYLLSRTDRAHNVSISEAPLSAYFSPCFPEKLFSMATNVPMQRAKALDGDYCTNEEPSLLLRIEFLNVQDIPGVMQDYPVLEFERFRLYQTREGLRRCLDVNSSLRNQLNELRQRLSEVMNMGEVGNSSGGGGGMKQQLMREFRSLLQESDETDSSNQAAYKSMMMSTPGSDHFATAFSFTGSVDAPGQGRNSPSNSAGSEGDRRGSGEAREPSTRISQLFSSQPSAVLPDFGSAPPTTTAGGAPTAPRSKLSSLGAALRTSKGGQNFIRGIQARASGASTSSVRFSQRAATLPTSTATNTKPGLGPSTSQSILKDSGQPQKSASLDRQHTETGWGAFLRGSSGRSAAQSPDQTVYASIAVPPSSSSGATSNAFAVVAKPSEDSEPPREHDGGEGRKSKFNPNIFKSVLPKRGASSDQQAGSSGGGSKSSTLPRTSSVGERSTDFFGNRSQQQQRPGPGIFNQPSSRSTSSLTAASHHSAGPTVQKVVPTPSPSSTLTRSGGLTSLNNPDSYHQGPPPTTISTAIVMPVQDVTYTEPDRFRKPPIPAPRTGLLKKSTDKLKEGIQYSEDKDEIDAEVKAYSDYPDKLHQASSDSASLLDQKPATDSQAFSRASIASIDDPMLQTDVYSLFAKAAKEGIKLVEEAPEMEEPLALAPPETAARQPVEQAPKPAGRAPPPEVTLTDAPEAAPRSERPRSSSGLPPLSPSILKKGNSFSGSQSAMVKKSRSANNVRFCDDNISVSSAYEGQGQSTASREDRQMPAGSYDQPDIQYNGFKGQYSGNQSASYAPPEDHQQQQAPKRQQQVQGQQRQWQQQPQQQAPQQQQQRREEQQQELQQQQQFREQFQKQQLLRQQQQQQQQQKQQQQSRQQEAAYTPPEASGVPAAAQQIMDNKQQYRLQQLRREHQEYVNQLLHQQQQPPQQRLQQGGSLERLPLQTGSVVRSDSNLSRAKSESSGVLQTAL